MALDTDARRVLAQGLGNDYIAKNIYDTIGSASQGTTAAVVAALASTTNITAVPGSFADAAAVQTYLAGANVIPNIETRLDNLEAKVNAILTSLKNANLMASS